MSNPLTLQRPWRTLLAAYHAPKLSRSLLELAVTAVPLAALWASAWLAASFGLWWLALLISVPASAFLVRLFMIQHDCGHMSFFKTPALNHWIGRAIGVLTFTPYDYWRRSHAIHHATCGNLDRRGTGDVATLTVGEYRALTPLKRLGYRLYRHPAVLFGLGPAFLFLVQHRLPSGQMREGWRPWISTLGTNAAIAALIGVAFVLGGWKALLLVHLPTLLLAASIGVWLFYVQHQFEETHYARQAGWDFTEAALRGSSNYILPQPLRWFTANIGVHHVHHISSRIPFYQLPSVLRDFPELRDVSKLGVIESMRAAGLSLWDEAGKRLISFADFRRAELSVTDPRSRVRVQR
ncbi:MAG: fatty acid desaturase [Hyphomonadaceae bacterium]|nr:fatty acid desaturase [Hyphomonadaceae bacterium]